MRRKTKEEFIADARKVHGNKYDYSKVIYINNKVEVCIICPIHGEFWQRPDRHLTSDGCRKCGYDEVAKKCKKSTENFIERARKVHGNKYDYSNVNYINNKTDVEIICPIHGKFLQKPSHHLFRGQGCPICDESHLEREIRQFLINNNEEFIQEYKTKWLGLQSLDFYLPKYKVGIECQGKQHFGLGGWISKSLPIIKERDERKRKLCEENGVKLLYYSNLGIKYPYKVYENKNEILKEIKS